MEWGEELITITPEAKEKNWLIDTKETIMLYGLPKHGKTFAYCSIVEHTLNKKGQVYVISTDAGFIRTAKSYFGEKITEVYKNIHLELVSDINEIRNYYLSIKNKLKEQDLVIIDLVSDVWEWAQIAFVDNLSGGDIQNFIIKAMKDNAYFGILDSNKWNYAKALHKFVEDIIVRKPCNFIGVCDEKDIDVELKRGGQKAKDKLEDLGFDIMSTRPGGMKLLPYKFETILRISCDDKGYFFQVVGDRGFTPDIRKNYYNRNMYKKLLEWRNKK